MDVRANTNITKHMGIPRISHTISIAIVMLLAGLCVVSTGLAWAGTAWPGAERIAAAESGSDWADSDTLAVIPCGEMVPDGNESDAGAEAAEDCEDQLPATHWDADSQWGADSDWQNQPSLDNATDRDTGTIHGAERQRDDTSLQDDNPHQDTSNQMPDEQLDAAVSGPSVSWGSILPPLVAIAIALVVAIVYRYIAVRG